MQVPLAFGLSMSDNMRVDMWLGAGAGLFPCLSVSTATVFSTVPYQRGDGECVEHDILSYSQCECNG